MFKYRVLTALIAIPIIFWIILKLPVLEFSILLYLLMALAAWEWARLMNFTSPWLRGWYVLWIWLLIFIFSIAKIPAVFLLSAGFLAQLWATFEIIYYQRHQRAYFLQNVFAKGLLGVLLLIPFWQGLMILKGNNSSSSLGLLFILVLIWAVDTGGYLTGRKWGRHKLIVKVSPNKTWEGVWGGLLLAVLLSGFSFLIWPDIGWQRMSLFLIITFIAMIFSIVGDLTVSLLKRLVGVKDCGSIFPGHGGMLDRIDSIINGVILFALGILWLGLS
jgi:phosphatidate cytidylyltransferase